MPLSLPLLYSPRLELCLIDAVTVPDLDTMAFSALMKAAPSTGHKDNVHGVPTYWSKSGHTLQKLITALATCDFLLFGFDVSLFSDQHRT